MPSFFAMEVATASVGLTIAPRATARAKSDPGIAKKNSVPNARALMTTRTTASPAIGTASRRNSIAGRRTADAYSSGGRMPTRISSGYRELGQQQ
jgi:hypothetical protein